MLTKLNAIHKVKYDYLDNPPHPTSNEIKNHFSEYWDKYFKFCFVRNPYEMAVSDYIWRVESNNFEITFGEFLERVKIPNKKDPEGVVPTPKTNWSIYTIDDNVAVDYIARYENIQTEMEYICNTIGIDYNKELMTYNKNVKSYKYKDYYNERTIELVRDIYKDEINYFGYEF